MTFQIEVRSSLHAASYWPGAIWIIRATYLQNNLLFCILSNANIYSHHHYHKDSNQ